MKKAVILLSGGLDSAANLAISVESLKPVLCLTFDYGQKASLKEIHASAALSKYYGVQHHTVDITWLGALGGSALTDPKFSPPEIQSSELDDLKVTQITSNAVWVPNRNGVFINIAASFAEKLQAEMLIVGFNLEEAATFADNSTEFLKASTQSLSFSTRNHVEVTSFTDKWVKKEIVRHLKTLKIPFPFDSVWSCYLGGQVACEKCESCQRYLRACSE